MLEPCKGRAREPPCRGIYDRTFYSKGGVPHGKQNHGNGKGYLLGEEFEACRHLLRLRRTAHCSSPFIA